MSELAQQIEHALTTVAPEHNIDIVDVEVAGSTKNPIVRVRIDYLESDHTIMLDEVAQENAWISAVLDDLDPIESTYTLEVSSPGLDRPLKQARDFERFTGNKITLKLTEGEKRKLEGELKGFEDGQVIVEVEGEDKSFSLEIIKECALKPEFKF